MLQTQNNLQWLILPDEQTAKYTNFDDGRPGDTSELIAKVNSDLALGRGHNDWRLPTFGELKALINTDQDPGADAFWSASPSASNSYFAWFVYFRDGICGLDCKNSALSVRLVRSGQ